MAVGTVNISTSVTLPAAGIDGNTTLVIEGNSTVTFSTGCANLTGVVLVLRPNLDAGNSSNLQLIPIAYECRVGEARVEVAGDARSCARAVPTSRYGPSLLSVSLSVNRDGCGLGAGALAGIVVAGVLLVLGTLGVILGIRSRRRRLETEHKLSKLQVAMEERKPDRPSRNF